MGGRDKLLEPVCGVPLIADRAATALAVAANVIIVLKPSDTARQAALEGFAVRCIHVTSDAIGLGHSIAAGAAAADDTRPLMILPADMPDLSVDDLAHVARTQAAHAERIARGYSEDGQPGHPVIFPTRCLPGLRQLTGDRGARPILADEDILQVALPGQHATTDLDTPEAWTAWRNRRSAD